MTLKAHMSVLSVSSEILWDVCVCVCVSYSVISLASWLHKLPSRCNLRVSTQTYLHTEKGRGVGSIFIISACESEPWVTERHWCQVRWYCFTFTEGRNNAIQRRADARGGHWEHWGGVQSVLHTHKHMQKAHRHTEGEYMETVEGKVANLSCTS